MFLTPFIFLAFYTYLMTPTLLAYTLAYYLGSDGVRDWALRWGTPVLLVLALVGSVPLLFSVYTRFAVRRKQTSKFVYSSTPRPAVTRYTPSSTPRPAM